MARIAKIDNVIACKENTPNLTQYVKMKKTVNPKDMTFFCGLGEEMYTYSANHRLRRCSQFIREFHPGLVLFSFIRQQKTIIW